MISGYLIRISTNSVINININTIKLISKLVNRISYVFRYNYYAMAELR